MKQRHMRRRVPNAKLFAHRVEFDLYKVNILRERVRRGSYHVPGPNVAQSLIVDHLTLCSVFDALSAGAVGDATSAEPNEEAAANDA